MEYKFGQLVEYFALDDNMYDAVVLGKHSVPADGDYDIAYQPTKGKAVVTCCYKNRLSLREPSLVDLLVKERQRAMKIAYDSMEMHHKKAESEKAVGNRMYFVEEQIADECRILANAISGGNAVSSALGETMRARIQKEYTSEPA